MVEGDDVLSAEQGSDADAPTVRCSVGAFTRWWMGTVSASGLALHDDFDAPPGLLTVLDRGIQTPRAFRGWDF